MHQRVKDALEEIDAAVLSGDEFQDPENLKELHKYIERWQHSTGHRGLTLEQIKAAVESGKKVHWQVTRYEVVKDHLGQWFIQDEEGDSIGLTWLDGTTLNGAPEDFFVGGVDEEQKKADG